MKDAVKPVYNVIDFINGNYSFIGIRTIEDNQLEDFNWHFALYTHNKSNYYIIDLDDPTRGQFITTDARKLASYTGKYSLKICDRILKLFKECPASADYSLRDQAKVRLDIDLNSKYFVDLCNQIRILPEYQAIKSHLDELRKLKQNDNSVCIANKIKTFSEFLTFLEEAANPQTLIMWLNRLNKFAKEFAEDLMPRPNNVVFWNFKIIDLSAKKPEDTTLYKLLQELKNAVAKLTIKVLPKWNRAKTDQDTWPQITCADWLEDNENEQTNQARIRKCL